MAKVEQAKPMTQEEIRRAHQSIIAMVCEISLAETAEGIDRDWKDFKSEGDHTHVRAAQALSRQFLAMGYCIAMAEASGLPVSKAEERFQDLLGDMSFRNSSLYAWSQAPEGILAMSRLGVRFPNPNQHLG